MSVRTIRSLPRAPDQVDPRWHARTELALQGAQRMLDLKQVLADQPSFIERILFEAIGYYELDPREDLPRRIEYGWKGQVSDQRRVDGRMASALGMFVEKNGRITDEERRHFSRLYPNADPDATLAEFRKLLAVRFAGQTVPQPRRTFKAGQARPHGNLIRRAACR